MAALDCIIHPHHVTLMRTPISVQSLFHAFADRVDPYYEYDGARSHKGLGRPRFNVTETETAYLVDGEFPGVSDKSMITVEWLQNQVLIVRGIISPTDTETATDPFQTGQLKNNLAPATKLDEEAPINMGKSETEAMTNKPQIHFPRSLLHERQIGECERSFTFPTKVDADGMKANLANGLLRIVIPKKAVTALETKSIAIQ